MTARGLLVRTSTLVLVIVTLLALVASALVPGSSLKAAPKAPTLSTSLVISQVYGAGGNSGATYNADFIEIFNRGASSASLNGLSLQYASATGTGNFGANATAVTELPNVSLSPGQYYLVQEAGGSNGSALPTPDLVDSTPIAMAAAAGKVVLVTGTTSLGCNGGSAVCDSTALARIIDLVGFGAANYYEGTGPTAAPSTTTSVSRKAAGCTETDDNSADFTAGAINPRNTATALNPCSGGNTATPTNTATVTVTPGGPTDTPTLTATPSNTPSPTNTVVAGSTRIHDIQGAAHLSPLRNIAVSNVPGIVTGLRSNGYYLEDPNPDADPATSEGIFVFTSSAPTVAVGDSLLVSGNVQEYRADTAGLTNTEITSPTFVRVSTGNTLPGPTVIGTGGRIPPSTVINDDSTGDVETSGVFDPANDGIDFYESLEGMRVQINNALATGPTHDFTSNRELPVVSDNGANASVLTPRGGIIVRANDFNPERIILNDLITGGPTLPFVHVGATFPGAIIGMIDYNFDNYKLEVSTLPSVVASPITRESTTAAAAGSISIGTFNVENLTPGDGAAKFNTLASLIVNNLKAPDVLVIEEIQDNNGTTNNGVVDASTTWSTLINAITSAGGPTYQYRQINPVDGADGGAPGGNIRQGFLFRTDRGLSFVDRAGGTSTAATTVSNVGGQPQISFSPGRIAPSDSAWSASRKPLIGEFSYNGRQLFIIGNHFNSKGGDDPLYGHDQPPVRSSETQRHQQATIVNDFVDQILAIDPTADIVVAGDLNDFQFSDTLTILKGGVLNDLIDTLPEAEQYSYDYDGNAQTLDHILVSNHLFAAPRFYDVVHVNSEFYDQASDHDPQIVQVDLTGGTTTPSATTTSTATETATVTPSATNTATETATVTPSATNTATNTATRTATATTTATATATETAVPATAVTWIDQVNVTASGNTITKSSANGGWDAGAASSLQIASGDGFVQMTVSSASTYVMFGLSNGDTDADYADIDFAIYTYANTGKLAVYENGVYRGEFGNYNVGDVLKVGIVGGVVNYYQNGNLFYNSPTTPTYPLLLDASIYTPGGQISNAGINGANLTAVTPWTPTATPTYTSTAVPIPTSAVVWADQVNVTASGNTITKSGGTLAWDAGAVSNLQIPAGDGYVEETVSDASQYTMFGLSNGDTDTNYSDIDFAIYTYASTGQLAVYEGGTFRGLGPAYTNGDVLRVAVNGGVVQYSRNGAVFYTSGVAPSYPLLLDASIASIGGQISNAYIAGNGLTAAPTWTPTATPTSTVTPIPQVCNPVNYINLLRASASGNTLTKTSATAGWNSGAISDKSLNSGDGSVTETIANASTYTMFGLGDSDNTGTYTAIDYAIYTYASTGQLAVYESGTFRGTFVAYTTGDTIKVAVEGGVVKYSKNGTVFYTSSVAPSYPLLLNAAIFTPSAQISNAQLCGQDLVATSAPPLPAKVTSGKGDTTQSVNGVPAAPRVPTTNAAPAQPVVPAASGVPARPVMPSAVSFVDVPSDFWAKQYIDWAASRLSLSGYDGANGREFRPYNNATRGQVVKLLVGAAGWSIVSGGQHFVDVPASNPFYKYIETAAAHNLISGYADGSFRPNDNLTRAQMTKLIAIAAGWQLSTPGSAPFSDVPTSDWAASYIAAAAQHGVVSGYADGTFKPAAPITRVQMTKMLFNSFAN